MYYTQQKKYKVDVQELMLHKFVKHPSYKKTQRKNFIMVMINIKEQFKNMILFKQIYVKKK